MTAVASLLALTGLRISEALGAGIADLDFEHGHRTLEIVRKGRHARDHPLAPRTSRAIDLYIGERTTGPIFLGAGVAGWTGTQPIAPSSGLPVEPVLQSESAPRSPALVHDLRT